jgi:hypothetical protein
MVEENDKLKLGIGNEEAISLKPATVKVLAVTIEQVGTKKSDKAVFKVLHPDSKEPINISSMKWESKGKLEVSGLWLNLDSAGKIRKGSGLAVLMNTYGVKNLLELVDKQIPTIQDDKGYLVFKVY